MFLAFGCFNREQQNGRTKLTRLHLHRNEFLSTTDHFLGHKEHLKIFFSVVFVLNHRIRFLYHTREIKSKILTHYKSQ